MALHGKGCAAFSKGAAHVVASRAVVAVLAVLAGIWGVLHVGSDNAEETVRQIQAAGGEASFVPADVTRSDQMEAAVRRTVESFGRLDCAFNKAGIVTDEPVSVQLRIPLRVLPLAKGRVNLKDERDNKPH